MKSKIITIAATAAMAAGLSFAQPAPATAGKQGMTHMQNRRARHQQMMQELNLNADQKAQAKTIFQKAWQDSKPVFDQLKQNNQALASAVKNNDKSQIQKLATEQGNLRGQLVANHELAMAQFYQILTPDQRTKADQMQQRAQARMEQRMQQMREQHQKEMSGE